MQLLDAKAFPARFVRPMPDWRWRTAMVKILCPCPIRSGSRLLQTSEFSRRPAALAGDERVPPFVPKHQGRRYCDGVSPFQVCLSARHHEHCQQFFFFFFFFFFFVSRRPPAPTSPRPAWPARPDRAHHVQKKKQMMNFESLAAKPKTTKLDEAQNHQIHTSRLP